MKVLIVDDHPVIHEVLGAVLRNLFPKAEVVGAHTLSQAVEQGRAAEPFALALLDLGLPDCSGLECLAVFRRAAPATKVVIFSAVDDSASIISAMEAGAAGYVPKTHTPLLIAAAVRLVAEGGTYVPPEALMRIEPRPEPKTALRALTPRQSDVLRLIVKGYANKEVAERLNIAEDTVKQHARAAYRVLGVSSRTQAMTTLTRRSIPLD